MIFDFFVGENERLEDAEQRQIGKTIPGISGYFNFLFEYKESEETIRAWRHYSIGNRILIQKRLYENYQVTHRFRCVSFNHPNCDNFEVNDDIYWNNLKVTGNIEPSQHVLLMMMTKKRIQSNKLPILTITYLSFHITDVQKNICI